MTSPKGSPVKRKRRGRPPSKPKFDLNGETTMSIAVTSPLNASHNSAAVLLRGVSSQPLMKLSPARRRSHADSTNGDSTDSTPKQTLELVDARSTTSTASATPSRGPYKRQLSSSPFSAAASDKSSSPLKTSPLSRSERKELEANADGTVEVAHLHGEVLSFGEQSPNVNPLVFSRQQVPTTPKSMNFSSILNSSPMYKHWYSQTPSSSQTLLTDKPADGLGIAQRRQPLRKATSLPGIVEGEPLGVAGHSSSGLSVASAVSAPETHGAGNNLSAVEQASKRRRLLPSNLKVCLQIGPDGKASVVTERKSTGGINIPSLQQQSQPQLQPPQQQQQPQVSSSPVPNMFSSSPFTHGKTPVLNNYVYNANALRIGVDPYVNGISSNEFDSAPPLQTPSKSPYNPDPASYQIDAMLSDADVAAAAAVAAADATGLAISTTGAPIHASASTTPAAALSAAAVKGPTSLAVPHITTTSAAAAAAAASTTTGDSTTAASLTNAIAHSQGVIPAAVSAPVSELSQGNTLDKYDARFAMQALLDEM